MWHSFESVPLCLPSWHYTASAVWGVILETWVLHNCSPPAMLQPTNVFPLGFSRWELHGRLLVEVLDPLQPLLGTQEPRQRGRDQSSRLSPAGDGVHVVWRLQCDPQTHNNVKQKWLSYSVEADSRSLSALYCRAASWQTLSCRTRYWKVNNLSSFGQPWLGVRSLCPVGQACSESVLGRPLTYRTISARYLAYRTV